VNIGLCTFSLRSFFKTPDDIRKSTHRLKEMGYNCLHWTNGMDYESLEALALAVKDYDMPVCLTHVGDDLVTGDLDALMEKHDRIGCKNIGIGGLRNNVVVDEKLCMETIEKLEAAAERMEKYGFKFFYHNHHKEFWRYENGETYFDRIFKYAPHFNFTPDTYWLQYGGADVADFLENFRGRMECVHLKDYKLVYDAETTIMTPKFAALGDGMLNFKKDSKD